MGEKTWCFGYVITQKSHATRSVSSSDTSRAKKKLTLDQVFEHGAESFIINTQAAGKLFAGSSVIQFYEQFSLIGCQLVPQYLDKSRGTLDARFLG